MFYDVTMLWAELVRLLLEASLFYFILGKILNALHLQHTAGYNNNDYLSGTH